MVLGWILLYSDVQEITHFKFPSRFFSEFLLLLVSPMSECSPPRITQEQKFLQPQGWGEGLWGSSRPESTWSVEAGESAQVGSFRWGLAPLGKL